jgi:hypothetical protein
VTPFIIITNSRSNIMSMSTARMYKPLRMSKSFCANKPLRTCYQPVRSRMIKARVECSLRVAVAVRLLIVTITLLLLVMLLNGAAPLFNGD